MLFTGLEVCSYNINRRQRDLKLFEFGKVYGKAREKYLEKEVLTLYMTGNLESENWQRKAETVQYHDIAQHVQSILDKSDLGEVTFEIQEDPLFEYAASLYVKKQMVGKLGKVKPSLLKDFSIKQELFYAELDTSLLFNGSSPKLVIKEVPKFPEVRRDLSLVIDKKINFAEIQELVLSVERRLIRDIVAFDVYEGKNIPEDKKAYALSFTLQDESKTLTDDEIDRTMSRLMETLEKKLGAIIRK
jgi:phenylalanyl-tRNA synthetase beta chain